MKTILQFLFFFFSIFSFGQIALEHTYNQKATRIKLEQSGEKYFEIKTNSNELVLYNVDHSVWKTITLPVAKPNIFQNISIFHLSETKINQDTKIEIGLLFNNETKIVSDDGTVLLTIPNSNNTSFDEIAGVSNKIIASGTNETKVYSVLGLDLENTYSADNLKRIILENSGEKYYVLDKVNNTALVYNSNHSLWKTVNLPKPTNATIIAIDFISESKINPDNALEVAYSLQETIDNTTVYSSKIVNETGTELLTVANSRKLNINTIPGLQDKLTADISINSFYFSTSSSIYSLPSLGLENAYSSHVKRIKLENGDEKYFTDSYFLDKNVNIYSSNHKLWKTLELSSLSMFEFIQNPIIAVNYLSETKINNDALMEFSFTYLTGLLGGGSEYASAVINENKDILLQNTSYNSLVLDEMQGLDNKLIGRNYFYNSSSIYSLKNLSTTDFKLDAKTVLSPNPTKSILNIWSLSTPIIEARIYNINGSLVKTVKGQNISKIDLNLLSDGIYLVQTMNANLQKSVQKISVLH